MQLGTSSAPVQVNSETLPFILADINAVMNENNLPDHGRWISYPPWMNPLFSYYYGRKRLSRERWKMALRAHCRIFKTSLPQARQAIPRIR